ncbi:hypothetical protein Vretimale_5257 [Volvox reticuliferus]|uniref:Uncharacterized protein n=1 Tax=Volvox reticuliferus TaxID=1737510 RepID=A0A8J4G5P3_9CHLO|nr:hypothetical protein Vretifemale_3597 [Volvox reticuliferus]GIM00485.1 hypothetical protein Vretimale_5257 [Volvox reticuliferus]
MRGALHAGAALHDPVAASLLAERTGMWGAAATGALPAGSSHLQQLARRQHHHTQPQLHEEGDYTGSAAAAAATAGGSSCMAMVAPPLRHGTDVVGGAGGAGGIRSTALRKQTEEQRQLLAVRAFGSFEDTAD